MFHTEIWTNVPGPKWWNDEEILSILSHNIVWASHPEHDFKGKMAAMWSSDKQKGLSSLFISWQDQQMLKGAWWCNKEEQRVSLRDGWVVEHGHSLDAQQHSQTPRNHVVEDNGAGGERNRVMRLSSQHMLQLCILRVIFSFFSFLCR